MGIINIYILMGQAQVATEPIDWMRKLADLFIPLVIVLGVVGLLLLSNWIISKSQFLPQTKNTLKRIIAIVIIFIGMFAVIFNLPIALVKQLEIVKLLALVLVVIPFIFLSNWIFNKSDFLPQTKNTFKPIIAIIIIFIGMFFIIFNLPIAPVKQLEIVKFLAVLFSAGIALSSTTVLGNLLSGVMNNVVKRFRNGDLIKIGDLQGRVTNKRFFHTEIQLEDSNFVSVPHLFVATHPV